MSKEIELVSGERTVVDDEDYGLASYLWYAHRVRGSKTIYAKAIVGGKTLYMHREVLGVSDADTLVDHIDRNGLNNTRSNLRCVTASENMAFWVREMGRLHIHAVKRRLKSGEVRTYYYHRPTRTRLLGNPGESVFSDCVAELNKNRTQSCTTL